MLFALIIRLRDETRTAYLLQGVESAWESVGKKRSFPSAFSSANHSAGARSKSGRDTSASMEEGAGIAGVREEMRGAEARTETPPKGDNVRFLAAIKIYKNVFPASDFQFSFCFIGPIGGSKHSECWRIGVSAVSY